MPDYTPPSSALFGLSGRWSALGPSNAVLQIGSIGFFETLSFSDEVFPLQTWSLSCVPFQTHLSHPSLTKIDNQRAPDRHSQRSNGKKHLPHAQENRKLSVQSISLVSFLRPQRHFWSLSPTMPMYDARLSGLIKHRYLSHPRPLDMGRFVPTRSSGEEHESMV